LPYTGRLNGFAFWSPDGPLPATLPPYEAALLFENRFVGRLQVSGFSKTKT
jgi:hypothetical protein